MKNKTAALALGLLIFASAALAGCGNGSSGESNSEGDGSSSGSTTAADITVQIYAQEHEKVVYQKLVDEFVAAHPDTVKSVDLQVTTQDEYNEKITAAAVAGTLPDIIYVGPGGVKEYVDNKYIVPLDDMIDANENVSIDELWPLIVESYRYDGTNTGEGDLYALPKDLSTFAYAYNKDMFDAAGLEYPDPENPYTYDEFLEVCQALTKDLDGDGEIDQWGAGFADAYMMTPFIYGNGATFLNEDYTKVIISEQEEFLEAFKFYTDLTSEYGVTPTVEQDAALGYYQRWLAGQLGFYACGTWDVSAFMDGETLLFDWDLCGWPVGPSGEGKSTTWLGTVGFAVTANCDYPDLALELISYLSTDLGGQQELSGETTGESLQVPNIQDYAETTWKENVVNGNIPYPSNVDVIFNYISGGNEKYNGIMTETTYTYNSEWFDTFVEGIANVKNGSISAEDYINQVEPKMQELLDKAIELENAQGN